MALKLIAFGSVLEYVFIKPKIMPPGDGPDFIGYGLAMAVLAFFGKMHIQDLSPAQVQKTLWSGLFGGLVGYAWLLLYLPKETRQIHHLLVANLAVLVGVLFGAWDQRRKRGGGGRRVVGNGFKTTQDFSSPHLSMGWSGMGNGMPVN